MQAVLWYTDTQKPKSTLEEHTHMITDVRFSPTKARLATSSFDRTVRVWDADNVSIHTLYFLCPLLLRSCYLWLKYFDSTVLSQSFFAIILDAFNFISFVFFLC